MGYDKLFDPPSADHPPLERAAGRLGDSRAGAGIRLRGQGRADRARRQRRHRDRPPAADRRRAGHGQVVARGDVARRLGWRFYAKTISSRTQARDLLWTFDTIRRLSDARNEEWAAASAAYVEPGVLWWAFDARAAAGEARGRTSSPDLAPPPREQTPEVEAASYPRSEHEQRRGRRRPARRDRQGGSRRARTICSSRSGRFASGSSRARLDYPGRRRRTRRSCSSRRTTSATCRGRSSGDASR